jgi:hypothetical protein
MAGSDPAGRGGTMAGLADLRGLELLVETGLAPSIPEQRVNLFRHQAGSYA